MTTLRLYLPVKPWFKLQGYGGNAAYYAKFKDDFGNPLKGHDGNDIDAIHGVPVHAAHDGMARFFIDSHGGNGILLRGLEETFDGFPTTLYWHLIGDTDTRYSSPIRTDRKEYKVSAGDLIGYANNTGAPYESTGDHLHWGLYFTNQMGTILNHSNGFNGRVDPSLYTTGIYAEDIQKAITLTQSLISILQRIVDTLSSKK